MTDDKYMESMTPEQASKTIQSAKLRATWQRFATAHQNRDTEATNTSLDIHLTEMRAVYDFKHDTLEQALTSCLPKQQEVQLNLKNHQQDLPKILGKELEHQINYFKEMLAEGEGDITLPLSRSHGILTYLVIFSRCTENIVLLSSAQIDISLSYVTLITAQTLAKHDSLTTLNANTKIILVKWLQQIFLEIICYYSFMCDRSNNWMNIIKSCKEDTLQDALSLSDTEPTTHNPVMIFSNLNAHHINNTTARGNLRMAVNAIFNSKECKIKHKLMALDLLGTFLCGGEEVSCGVINDSTFSALLGLVDTCPEHRDLVVQCVLIYIQQTHNSRPDKRQIDVRSLLSIYLQQLNQKAKDNSLDMLSLYIELIPRILRVRDRPSLQSSFLGVFVFDKLFKVMVDCNTEQVIISSIAAFSALMRKSSSSKEEFESNIGYQQMLKNITTPTDKIICALLDMVVEGSHNTETCIIENIELLKVLIRWCFELESDNCDTLVLYVLETAHNIVTHDTLSTMRCCSGGIITVITSILSNPPRALLPVVVEQLMCILEQIGGYSISAIEVRQYILLFQLDNNNRIRHFTDRLQVALERMAKGKGTEGPNHFFDLQHQTAGISVPEIKIWPGGKNCYTFVCWFKLDLKSAATRPLSPDTVSEERYTLYSFYNANGYGFEAFFQPDGTLHVAICNKKEFSTTSIDHPFLDNKWHFLGVSHRGSPLLGMGEVCVKIDKQLTNKLQLTSVNTNQPFTSCTIGGASLRQASTQARRTSGNILQDFGSFITSKTTQNKDINVVSVTPGMQDEHYGIPTSLHGQLGPVALFYEALTPQELIVIHENGPNNLSLFQSHFTGQKKEIITDLADKLVLYYNAKASKNHVVLDLVENKVPGERLNGRLTGHNLSTWNIKDILACVGGVQLIFPLLECIGPVQYPQSPANTPLRPVYLRSHYISESSVGLYEQSQGDEVEDLVDTERMPSTGDFDVVKQSGSIESLPDEQITAEGDKKNYNLTEKHETNRVARFFILLEEMLRDCPTNQESLLSTDGFAVIGALLVNIPPIELNMQLVKALQSICLLLSYDRNPTNDEAYSPLLLDVYQHILFNFELWARVDHEVRVAHIQYLSVIIKDNLILCRKLYGVQFMLDAVRLYCSNSADTPDTACVLRRAIFGFVKFYMRHGIQPGEVKALLSFISVTPQLDQKLEAIEQVTILVEVPPTSLPLARCLASVDCQDLLVGLLHTPCNELKVPLLKLIRVIVSTCTHNGICLPDTTLCYLGEAITACSIDGHSDIVDELLSVVTIVVTAATEQDKEPDVTLMQSLIRLLPRFALSIRLHVSQELLVLTRTNPELGTSYGSSPAWYDSVLCLMLGDEQDDGLQEQLFVTVMEFLHTILWKCYELCGSFDKQQIGKLILSIDELSPKLFKTANVVKMRLYELTVHSMNLELKKSGYDGTIAPDHVTLLEFLEHFMFSKEEESWEDLVCVKAWSSKLVQEILLFFNLLGVWDENSNVNLYRISLRVLLGCLHHPSYEYVSAAASKLHTLIEHPYFESFYTASYVLGTLHYVLVPTLEDEVNQLHILLVPLVHSALSRWGTLLGMDQDILTEMPADEHATDFMDDFLMYIDAHEWETFISNQVYPAVARFSRENNDTAVAAVSRQFQQISELLQDDIIAMDEAKMKRLEGYEKDIWCQYNKRQEFESNRHILDTNDRHTKHHAIIKVWKERKKFMTSDRGIWGQDGNNTQLYWKRDTHETYSRMRLKMGPNNEFEFHEDAKFYDEGDVIREPTTVNLLGVSEEVRIRGDKETQEQWEVIMSSSIPDVTDDDQLVFFEDCHLVTLLNIVPGTIKVSPTHIFFYEHSKDDTPHKMSNHNICWKIKHIREIHLRRYNLRYSAIEFFLTDQTNYFINFNKYHRNNIYSKIMSLRPPKLVHGITKSPEEMLASSNLTKKWMEHRISNFEYLMNLNTIAGRTYNDLSQYPVFPWVLNDYDSDSIDLANPLSSSCFRDLSKPIGAQVPERAEHADIKYHSLPQDGLDPPFHWGTHYSNPGAILYFLVRMEPYTSLHIELHGRFDHPDRQFYSIGQSYKSSTQGQGDCKELIPEFYYLPEFLMNSNKFDFGLRHDGTTPEDVELPAWAKSPEEFIVKHREALECEYVSNHIHEWIDLIFGYRQQGSEAMKALNVYHYTSYEGQVDLDNEKDPKKRRALEAQISNFGQTPRQIFKDPHPKRMVSTEASSLRGSTMLHILRAAALKANAIQMGTSEDPVVFVGVAAGVPNQVIERGVMDNLITISSSGIYGIHNWLARWTGNHPFYCEKDTQMEEGIRSISGPFCPSIRLCNVMRLSVDGNILFSAGLWDNSIRVGKVDQQQISPLTVYYQHKDIITCMELNGKYIATGARDTTVVIWKLRRKGTVCKGLKPHPANILYGHNSEVTCVDLSQECDVVISGSKEGIVLIHTLKSGTYVRTLVPHVPTDPESGHFSVSFVGIAGNGNILLAGKLPSKNTKEGYHSVLYLYTINGKLIKRVKLEDETTAMFVDKDRVVLGGLSGSLEIRCTNYINVKHRLRLKSGVLSISKDPRDQHLFVATADGKLLIITATAKPFKR